MRKLFVCFLIGLGLIACGGALNEIISESKETGDMLSKCRARSRKAYYFQEAGLDGALKVYEECKLDSSGD